MFTSRNIILIFLKGINILYVYFVVVFVYVTIDFYICMYIYIELNRYMYKIDIFSIKNYWCKFWRNIKKHNWDKRDEMRYEGIINLEENMK